MCSEIWIGTIEISYFHPDAPDARKSAFTVVTTWANSLEEFCEKCRRMLESYRWTLIGVEKANPVPENYVFNEVVSDMLERTRVNPNAVIYGTFHTYPVM
jgi:hypothetical protein